MKDRVNLPLLITRGLFVFPGQKHTIEVGRNKSVEATMFSNIRTGGEIIVVAQKNPTVDFPVAKDIFQTATVCKIKKITEKGDGSLTVVYEGLTACKITKVNDTPTMFTADFTKIVNKFGKKTEEQALVRKIAGTLESIISNNPSIPTELIARLSSGIDALELANGIAQYMPMSLSNRADILKEANVNKKLKAVLDAIVSEKEISAIETKLGDDIKTKMNDQQKEFYLREKLKQIKEELGETGSSSDVDAMREKLAAEPYPANIKERVTEELNRLENIPASSAESSVVRNYVDWMMKTPWYQKTEDNADLTKVRKTLDKHHYSLEKVKERIVEYLAVKANTNSLKSPILCLVGPPGVGKTSLAYSIAEAIDRKFIKVSLGGVKDESEIRGHRKTYLGSMPGRIIQGMKKAEVINPVFLLDEIDKMASDFKGDPASAMLEVLDPEQNKEFSDHYLEESYDLSNVMFIATANYIQNIPDPLRDRLEIIQLSSYTEMEKVKIASKYLVKKARKDHGLKATQFKVNQAEILYLVRHYTREAGVRQLQRLINSLARKTVVKILSGKKDIIISEKMIVEMLGKPKFDHSKSEKKPQVGVATGLAYTQYGGDILPVEVNQFVGKGKLVITGQLGDVMKESVQIALSFVKANAKKYGIDSSIFASTDFHVHVPEGAVPKDGPSAGITITTALISSLTNTPISKEVGMTGEINLRGHVLPIGGLKEKAISAHRSKLKTIIVPKENEKDLDDIPKEIKKQLKIIPVSSIDQVLKIALVK